MLAAMHRREACHMIFLGIRTMASGDGEVGDGEAGCMEVVDYEGFIFNILLVPTGVVFPLGVGVLRLALGLVVGSCTCYLPLGLVPTHDCDAFYIILDGCMPLRLVPGGHPYQTYCDEDLRPKRCGHYELFP